jgi:hypothetical protein
MITRENFFAVPPKIAVSEVKDTLWGTVYVRRMSLTERDEFDKAIQWDLVGFRARLVAMTTCNEDGSLVFRLGDMHRLSEYPYADLAPIIDESMKFNKFSKEDADALEKKSKSHPSDSSSDSQDTSDGA